MNEQIGNKINDKTYIPLTPFKGFVLENFPFIEADFDAITNYQLLCKVIEYLNNVISNQNTVQELGTDLVNAYNSLVDAVNLAINEFKTDVTTDINQFKIDINDDFDEFTSNITTQFNNLHDYVYNYFDNLDVQEEINNKLDSMVQAGTLQEIVADYLNSKALFGFDNVASMKISTNLINGSYAETLGYYAKNDGGASLYKIRTKTNDDVTNEENIIALNDNTLVAELIIKNKTLNVKQYGAYGNNTNDDTNSIQHAVNYCQSNNLKLYIPSGQYKITTTLEITGCPIEGTSSTTTYINLNNCDGLLLKQYNKENICEISNIAIVSSSINTEIAGITYQKYENGSNIRSRGYKLTNLYFYNLGCAIEVQDSFRNIVKDIGINNCYRALFIKNQCVQSSFTDVIANNDLDPALTSTRFGESFNSYLSIGVEIGVANEAERPEGIILNHVCCTNFNVGCMFRDALYFNAKQCEFDLSHQRALLVAGGGQGGTTFDGCWFANKPTSTNPIVEFYSGSTTDKFNKTLINCSVYNSSTQNDVVGIAIGKTYPYGWNLNVKNCNVSNAVNCQLKYGIQLNRIKGATLESNDVYGCITDIKVDVDGKNQIINNKCDTIDLTSYSGTTVYALNNIYTTKTITMGGTLIGNFD